MWSSCVGLDSDYNIGRALLRGLCVVRKIAVSCAPNAEVAGLDCGDMPPGVVVVELEHGGLFSALVRFCFAG